MMRLWCGLWRGVLSGFGLLLACLALQAQAATLELREAQATVTVQGQTIHQAVSLPYHWDRHHKGLPGQATFEMSFELPEVPALPFGLYVPRLGNAYEIWLNGTLLQRNGDLQNGNGADFAKGPRHIVISPGLLGTNNLIRVHIRADVGRRGGLAALTLGPDDEVRPIYLSDYRWRSTGSLAVVILSLLIGMVALALWATQVDVTGPSRPRRDSLYLIAALAELCWTLRVGDVLIENPPVPWPWWGMVTLLSVTAWICSMILFCVEVAGWGRLAIVSWLRRWLALLLAASVAAALGSLAYGHPVTMTLLYAALGLTCLIFVSLFIWKAAREASIAHRLVAGALLLNTLVGLRDLYVFRLSPVYGGNTLLRYSSVLFGLALAYIVITRFRAASGQARDLMANMSARVAQKERELAQTYQRVEQLAREQERTSERTRILRDMHDGVGSHISTAIRQLESGRASQGEVLHTLRDSLDQLKLSIDAMNLPPGDITALLANLRYRLEPRFKASDMELQWDVDLLPLLPRLDHKAMRHLQFMVFEALSNVLQHAHASVLRIELRTVPGGGVKLLVIDNGCGFEPDRVKRRGLSSLRERAAAIEAGLVIVSAPGNTVVEISLD
ncbi:sensor histidine kinase [Rhodoferax sp.]|uniref:sensor histidine kinase n=1 Tax=Rhodoferax sp. TaxID=50421 RepID=UPI0027174810|nr:ATP-binding protein [Rhodoferax sp.]MDO9198939.1 histidine kinase [Rhodoferax sp.]